MPFKFSSGFLTLTYILQHQYVVIYTIHNIEEVEAGSGKNGPKRCNWHHLGPR